MNKSIISELEYLDRRLQLLIDVIAPIRQAAPGNEKQVISYVSKKIDVAGKAIGMALERISEVENVFASD